MPWSYDGRDPGISLFSACLAAGAPMVFGHGDDRTEPFRVLEIGCCESDWLHRAAAAWPEIALTGVDCRAPNVTEADGRISRIKADALNPDLFPSASFDAIVSLSAIEHFGLGHYGDPTDADGDSKILANGWRWLKPGGWLYFDVPYDPTGYRVQGTECRVYDDQALIDRFDLALPEWAPWRPNAWRAYAVATSAGTLIEKPIVPAVPFYYCAMVWRKA